MVNKELKTKLDELPMTPGVYFHKDKSGKVIYIGKAARLKNRVKQYFQSRVDRDFKTSIMVKEIANVDWIETESEMDALFLESELIRRYQPRFNIELRDDKSLQYVRINTGSQFPFISTTRVPLDDGAQYIGPFSSGRDLAKVLKILRRIYPYSTHAVLPKRVCLQYHLGLCPGIEENKISQSDYRQNINRLIMYLKGQRRQVQKITEKEMKQAAKKQQFELAAKLRNQLRALQSIQHQIVFGDSEFIDISKDLGLKGLQDLLELKQPPERIEAYDISHFGGSQTAAGMVVFSSGIPNKKQYRHFKIRISGNNDYASMAEVIRRRFSPRNLKWPAPDLILIDGGKGQVTAALQVLQALNLLIPLIGLAKRYETLIVPLKMTTTTQKTAPALTELSLDKNEHVMLLLRRIRDESHRFAVRYHTMLRTKHQTSGLLDEITGIGPATRRKLMKKFGSISAAAKVSDRELETVIGRHKTTLLRKGLITAQAKKS